MKRLNELKLRGGLCLMAASLLLAPIHAGAQSSKTDKWPAGVGHGAPTLSKHYKATEAGGFEVEEAWKMGITGKGVNVAVSDGGIDFGAPDLYGAQARVTTKGSPYLGWPIVIDLHSTTAWQDMGIAVNQFIDMSSTDTTGYKVSGTSKSGVYHIGTHPEYRLKNFWGKDVKVLLVDENKSGVYDTVYMDLNCNQDFSDDKPCRKGDEIAVWDRDKDGLSDESGGMIYFIADGTLPVPLGRLLYGAKARIPKNGELLAIHYDSNSHGTMCAGTIGARGRIVKGMAPQASLIPVLAFPDDIGMLISVLGYDGKPETGDEANIVSRSAGFPYGQKGADELSAFLEYLTTKVAPRATLVFAASNEGSGYATITSPSTPHVITGGAIEDLWFKNSPNRGDVAAFSARGPNVMGLPKPNVLGTGAFTPRVRPLVTGHNGASAYDMGGGGTSNGCPHVSGLLALIYQSYKQANGVFPTSEEARDILMSAADDINDEPFAQGAGMINGYKAAMLALKKGGVLAKPAFVSPGQPIPAGSNYDARVLLQSYARKDIKAVPQHLVRTGSKTFKVPANKVKQLISVPKDILNGDFLRISSYVPSEGHRDWTLDDTARFGFWVSAYNWTDVNHDGTYGPADSATVATAQKDEVVVLSNTDWSCGGTSEARLHDPLKRVKDGLLIGLEHAKMDPGREVEADECVQEDTDVMVVVESFTWQPWDTMKVVQKGNELQCSIQAPENTGIYEGRILVTSDGGKYRQSIPVAFSTYRNDGIKLAGTNEIYENNRVYAKIEGSGRDGYRDDRIFALKHEGDGLLSIKTTWEDPLTDLDMALYAPSTVDTSKTWSFSAPAPIKFPVLSMMKEVGRTPRRFQTGHKISNNTDKTLIAQAGNGVNILVINSTINSRNRYGENINITTQPIAASIPEKTDLTGIAGKTLEFQTAADAVYGFGQPMDIKPSREAFRFEARKGDRLLVKFGEMGDATLLCDTNGDGKGTEDKDEVILRDMRWGNMFPDRGIVITLPFDGTYFLEDFYGGSATLLTKRIMARDGKVSIDVPLKAGTYYGVSELNGNIVLGNLTLEVKSAEAARIEMKAADKIFRGRPFTVDLKAVDVYGNPVARDLDAVVSMEDAETKTQIKAGQGSCEVKAPAITGRYSLVVKTSLGLERIKVNVDKGSGPAAVEAVKVTPDGITARVVNMSGSDIAATVYANPAGYLSVANDGEFNSPMEYVRNGYKAGYLPLSGKTRVELKAGEEKVVTISFTAKEKPEAASVPYIVALVDDQMNVLGYSATAEPKGKAEGLQPASQIKETRVNGDLSFAAEGLVSLQLNEEAPLFFLVRGGMSIILDAKGTLTVRIGKEVSKIQVVETVAAPAAAPAVKAGPGAAVNAPGKVTGLTLASEKDGVRLTWKAPAGGAVDHYLIFRVGSSKPWKIGESRETQYLLKKIDPWNSCTVRIVAVNKDDVEGEPSEVAGIVYNPFDL